MYISEFLSRGLSELRRREPIEEQGKLENRVKKRLAIARKAKAGSLTVPFVSVKQSKYANESLTAESFDGLKLEDIVAALPAAARAANWGTGGKPNLRRVHSNMVRFLETGTLGRDTVGSGDKWSEGKRSAMGIAAALIVAGAVALIRLMFRIERNETRGPASAA